MIFAISYSIPMHPLDVENYEGQDVTIIGRFESVEDGVVILKCMDKEIQVRHRSIESYKTGIVRVNGIVENGVVVENSVFPIGNEFDMETYGRFVAVAAKYQDLF
ncbi:hypothetical protein EROM_070900 [Encephalitozoon romaleae SJ-2008]|uniref:Replication factor A protein 3 n=1 Tax=Encephalitozoon romaleae (strain SJ-2008) TaxID=1178016 RepID=I6ZUH9_ENCRO|nr:hypothetical protein EROM_070900 [Encephalitozoon romaleae SJ-2008]AFN83341.1 hypothetical protein EROM_070900 [Encephalitozoon romaleae SJ-2008]